MNRTPEKMVAFCAALAETCNVGKACKAVGMGRATAYEWREADKEFAQMWDRALRVGVTMLEDEAHRRGFDGVDVPLTHKGQFTYLYTEARDAEGKVVMTEPIMAGDTVISPPHPKMVPVLDEEGNHRVATMKSYSDTLAIFLLKAHNPDKYRENQTIVHEVGESLAARMRQRGPLA